MGNYGKLWGFRGGRRMAHSNWLSLRQILAATPPHSGVGFQLINGSGVHSQGLVYNAHSDFWKRKLRLELRPEMADRFREDTE